MNGQLIATAATGLSIIVTLAVFLLRLDRRFGRLERRMDGLAIGVRSLNQQISSLFGVLSGILAALHKAGSLPDEDYRQTTTALSEMLARATGPYVESITATANPLAPEEARRFRELVAKARRRDFFTGDEVEEYNILLRRIQEERADDPGIWPLVALGAFLLGLYSGGRRQRP